MELATERLRLRPVRWEDAADLYAYSREPDVGPSAGWKPHASPAETRAIMETVFVDREGVFGIVLPETGRLVGTIGLVDDPKRENPAARMLGYALSPACWGRGYMTEAALALLDYGFSRLELELISAYCYPDNMRSRRVLEKCGFSYEGCLRRCEVRYDGQVLDNLCFARVRPLGVSE